MKNLKSIVIFSAILSSFCLNSIAQQFTGFKNTDAQKKLELNFDSQLSAKRIGENIKLMSSVPHHIGSVGGKFVADEIAKQFKASGWDTKIVTYQLLFPTPITRVLVM
jgi:N-acetylated-alpha-linked acidic dipeptidase